MTVYIIVILADLVKNKIKRGGGYHLQPYFFVTNQQTLRPSYKCLSMK